jgi:hypothetical protein
MATSDGAGSTRVSTVGLSASGNVPSTTEPTFHLHRPQRPASPNGHAHTPRRISRRVAMMRARAHLAMTQRGRTFDARVNHACTTVERFFANTQVVRRAELTSARRPGTQESADHPGSSLRIEPTCSFAERPSGASPRLRGPVAVEHPARSVEKRPPPPRPGTPLAMFRTRGRGDHADAQAETGRSTSVNVHQRQF